MNKPEVWLRGPLDNIPGLLQPVAHALLQAREEINALMDGFPEALLWEKLSGMASPGFHLQHLAGVLNRLFTYAKGEQLNRQQLTELALEGHPPKGEYNTNTFIELFNKQVDDCLIQLANADELTLTDSRGVGRAKLPSTIIGLYVHAAEHTMRHTGQLLVTVKVLVEKYQDDVDSRLIT
ncbi:DinB family protein [Mucilaginibacter sp. BJC16-A38]|uniref:DinB family protein n=1 Tax=Mucilaginibacter phenanthrenivorans TaxID=1234842 RepID=UPI0021571537|nr:DinB family protein [Mucilaginibacter phenanthrenivorans]MCR8560494.1 DinB family protein [Mucilaginibacter phenanthrenivorans]